MLGSSPQSHKPDFIALGELILEKNIFIYIIKEFLPYKSVLASLVMWPGIFV